MSSLNIAAAPSGGTVSPADAFKMMLDMLLDGATDIETKFMFLMAAVIPIVITVFAVGWLIPLFKRKMNLS